MTRRAAALRAKERANLSFFIFIMFFAVFGLIVLTELLMLDRASSAGIASRAKLVDDIQNWVEVGGREVPPAPPPIAREPRDAVWQIVDTEVWRYKFYVYSAYVERRLNPPAIRVIAATRTRNVRQFWCQINLASNRSAVVSARIKPIRENWNLMYSASFVLCPLSGSGIGVDDLKNASVSIVASENAEPTNMLRVLDTKKKKRDVKGSLYVCVKPFHFSYGRALWLLEWMELQMLLGVTHFIMYEESLSGSARCVLEHYREQGAVTLLPWKLNITSKIEIRNQAQFAAFNDCLYRSMSYAEWLIPIDVDEVVLPRQQDNLPSMLHELRRKPVSAFLFRNAFFYTRWEDDDTAGGSALLTVRKTRRWAVPHAVKNRSKYAVQPRSALELGNHFVWAFAPGGSAAEVSTEVALLHHYRMQCEFGGNGCLKVASVVDRTARRWADTLESRVSAVHAQLQAPCRLQPRTVTT